MMEAFNLKTPSAITYKKTNNSFITDDEIEKIERSVIRAIQSFIKAGLIMVECKYTNRYKFTQKLLNLCGLVKDFKQDDNLSDTNCQNVIKQGDNLSHHEHTNRTKRNNKVVLLNQSKKVLEENAISDEEVLRIYAEKHAKSNINGYVNALKIKGVAADIIRQYREKEGVQKYWERQAAQTSELVKELASLKGDPMPKSFKDLKKTLFGLS